MKKTLTLVFLFSTGLIFKLSAQAIKIEMQKFPFCDIVEWPEHGLLLIAKDPNRNTLQQELSFVNKKGELAWQEHYMPMAESPHIITSQESDYVYFTNQTQVDDAGKFYFNQVSHGGYIKKESIFFPPIFRKLDSEIFAEYTLINIINSYEDLIFHFRKEDKKNKQYKDVLIFYNHVLLKAYPAEISGVFLFAEMEKGTKSLLQYVGSKKNTNYFANAVTKNKRNGYDLYTYNGRGALIETSFLPSVDDKIKPINLISNRLDGAFYMEKNEQPAVIGQLLFYKNTFYLIGGNESEGISLWKYKEEKAIKTIENIAVEHKKSSIYSVGASFLNDHVVLYIKSDETTQTMVFDTNGVPKHIGGDIEKNYERNPSQLLFTKKPACFVIKLGDGVYEINKQELSKTVQNAVFKRQ